MAVRFILRAYTLPMIVARLVLVIALMATGFTAFSQKTYRGIVVDSVAVSALPGVHVKLKNAARGVITDGKGMFTIAASPTDTLLFTLVGYHTLELPLLLEEDALIIRLGEHITFLKEITVQSTRLLENTITRSTRTYVPKPISDASAATSPFDYFSRWQRERRKLVKLVEENNRTLVYLQVVSDQEIRESLMDEFELTEREYYDRLVTFNAQSGDLRYATDPDEIVRALKSFLKKSAH